MTRRVALACTVLLSMAAAGPALAADFLSGSYRPAREQSAPDAPAPLRVQAAGDGWIAWFEGQPQVMQPMGEAGLARLFPGIDAGGDIQCAATPALVFCHVAPGTPLPESDAVSATGYFTADANGGVYELERLP